MAFHLTRSGYTTTAPPRPIRWVHMDAHVARLIEHFSMERLPIEETFFVKTWRSTAEFANGNPVGTAMIGMYTNDPPSRSLFHRLSVDEMWHFYAGDPIRLVLLFADGTDVDVVLGPDVLNGQYVQFLVPAGTWQAGELTPGGRYGLFGCTLAPGFVGTCFQGGQKAALTEQYPTRADDIARLGVSDEHPVSLPDGFET